MNKALMRAGEDSREVPGCQFFSGNKGLTRGRGNFNFKQNTFYG
jgi:hypothetical protein